MRFKSFSLNSDFYASLLADLSGAKKRIYIETYIYREDEIGKQVKEILVKKAAEGVDVKILMDAIGSITISELNFSELIMAGGDVGFFRRLFLLPFHLTKINNRDHRKIVVIDDKLSYVGSANLDHGTSSWREFNVRIDDPKFNDVFSQIFIQQFMIANSLILGNKKLTKTYSVQGIDILRSAPFLKNPIKEAFEKLISEAKKEIIIENPYIIMDNKLAKCLRQAIENGVSIKLLLPHRADIHAMEYLNRHFMMRAKKMGMKVHIYPSMLHSKVILVDGKKWMLGSSNLEYRSMFTQFEIMLKGEDEEMSSLIANHLKKGLEEVAKNGQEFDGKLTPKERFFGKLLYPVKFLF